MSEPAKVRLVRCPKCQNLLPELADYSVYQCGGCGAVLRAKDKIVEVDTVSHKSDEERVRDDCETLYEKSANFKFEESGMNLRDGSENDIKYNDSSSRRGDKSEFLTKRADNERNRADIKSNKWTAIDDLEIKENLDDGNGEMGKSNQDLRPPNRIASEEGGENEGLWRKPRRDAEGMRYSTSKYSEDGPSDHYFRYNCGYGEPVMNQNKTDEFSKVEYLEQDRAALLRKLDELKDQLNRSCDVNDKLKAKVAPDQRFLRQEEPFSGPGTWYTGGSSSNRGSLQYPVPSTYVTRPYVSHYPEPSLYMYRHDLGMHRFYPSMHTSNQAKKLGDPLGSDMIGRAQYQTSGCRLQQPSQPYASGQYESSDTDPFQPYPPSMNLGQPSCSCFHCYNKHPQLPAPVLPVGFHDRMYPVAPDQLMNYRQQNPSAFHPHDYNPEISNPPPLNSHNPQFHTRWASNLNTVADGFVCRRLQRVVLATGGRRCRPVAGGSPFLMCHNCHELLQLPKNVLLIEKNQKKVQCGACSSFILLAVVNKKLVVSCPTETKKTSKKASDIPGMTVTEGTSNVLLPDNKAGINFSSDDYDNSGYDFQSMGFCSSKSAEIQTPHSASPYSSEVSEDSPESLNALAEESNSAELAAKINQSPPPVGSPLQNHLDSNKYSAVNRFGKGNQSGRSDREKEEPKKSIARPNSMKDVSLESEMEVPHNDCSNTGASQESGNACREDQLRVTRGGQSFFAGIIKKSFRDFSRSNQTIEQSTTNVTINGHYIPDRLLKKAEKLAGPIHPGQYWYDVRAGFWGVMGGPCLGIIPPYIEELNYPMPENCAGGSTGVYVNGRELHQKDLDLLSSRGLPTTKDGSYIIEISGRVLNEDSGEELDSLGKLAPTVEKLKHGFGMKVPRVAPA